MFASPALLTWAIWAAAMATLRMLVRCCLVRPARFLRRAWRAARDPRLGRGRRWWRVWALAALAAVVLLHWPARAQQRTATWYADNPEELVRVRRWCLDNPGPAFRSDDCAAAQRGGLIVAERETAAWLGAQDAPAWPPAHPAAPAPEPEAVPAPPPPLPAAPPRRGPPRRT